MRRSPKNSQPAPQLQDALDWLSEPKPEDPLLDLVPLRQHIAAIGKLRLPVLHRLKIDELLQERAERVDDALVPMLLDVKLPLPLSLGTVAQGLIGLRAELGETWLALAHEADPEALAKVNRSRAQNCLRGMSNLSRQFLAVELTAIPTPAGFWRNAQALYHQAHDAVDPTATLPAEITAIDSLFKAMLAMTAAQPEGLTPREIVFLADYLKIHAPLVQIDPIAPEAAGDWFWLDRNFDQPPIPIERMPPIDGSAIYFRLLTWRNRRLGISISSMTAFHLTPSASRSRPPVPTTAMRLSGPDAAGPPRAAAASIDDLNPWRSKCVPS
jgi:hypothetical protein